ncbi:MAG: hypothetical protein ACI81V_001205 [Lentimonas sp.]|jgi:hypothetical protein
MQTDSLETRPESLAKTLERVLITPDEQGPSIGEMTSAVGEKGFGLILLVLALPSALPVPAPGYSTPFGIVITLVALQMLFGRDTLWLPQRLRVIRIKPSLARKMLGAATKFLHYSERWIRPRQRWIRSKAGQAALALVIIVMANLMILPIPLTNTAPAMVIFLIGIGLAEEDGLLAIMAFALGCAAIALYAYIIYIVLTQGREVIEGWKDWLKGKLGLSSGDE